jgi:hypothetical protein
LSIAAQKDDVELASFLLSYWKTCDKDRYEHFNVINYIFIIFIEKYFFNYAFLGGI